MNNQMTECQEPTAKEIKAWGAGHRRMVRRAKRKEAFGISLLVFVFLAVAGVYIFIFYFALFFIPDSWGGHLGHG
jgi:hypothetical protein